MKAFKGFNKDLTCRGFQYEEGKEFETAVADVCNSGFHACEYPLDCFAYHNPAQSVYHEVDLDGDIDTSNNDDSKVCATKIKVGAKINIAGMVKCAIDFTMSRVKEEAGSDCGASSATDPTGVALAWGYEARAKGCKGSHLILSDWEYIGECWSDGTYRDTYNVNSWKLRGAKLVEVDGEEIKEDTYYRCIDGNVVEVDENSNVIG